jgi:hypothetical protein
MPSVPDTSTTVAYERSSWAPTLEAAPVPTAQSLMRARYRREDAVVKLRLRRQGLPEKLPRSRPWVRPKP